MRDAQVTVRLLLLFICCILAFGVRDARRDRGGGRRQGRAAQSRARGRRFAEENADRRRKRSRYYRRKLFGDRISGNLGGAAAQQMTTGGSGEFAVMMQSLNGGNNRPPNVQPTPQPTPAPTEDLNRYIPGNLTHEEDGVILSSGLTARIIAETGVPVQFKNGGESSNDFHIYPDGGDTFEDLRPNNEGGWIYVSNSESQNNRRGSVGGITFDKDGNVIGYERLLERTSWNCGGGRTPWNTWISCEEISGGQCWQVDPMGIRPPQATVIGGEDGGEFESFAYDVRDWTRPRYFVTEDEPDGALRRFTPDPQNIDWSDPWDMLHGDGTLEFLILEPAFQGASFGYYRWTTDLDMARDNADWLYPKSEGIDVHGSRLYFVCKEIQSLFELDLDGTTYIETSTRQGLFNGQPDGVRHIIGEDGDLFIYFTEDGGLRNGIHARDQRGQYFTIAESTLYYYDETTGFSMSPDGKHMYFAFQGAGVVFDVTRIDGQSFHAKKVDLKYHATERNSRKK